MEPLVVAEGVVIPASDLSWSASRASGPGGQNVNKVATKVDLRFDLPASQAIGPQVKARLHALARGRLDGEGRIVIVVQETRDQQRNLEAAREKLRELVRRALVPPKRRLRTRPSRGAVEARLRSKRHQSEKKRTRRDDGT